MPARLLIIDDEQDVRAALRMVLEYDGYAVEEASGGREGLERARATRPDLVFVDVRMAPIDGVQVLRELRAEAPALPVIMISGHGTIATAVEATRLGAFDFIEKPLGSERVLVAVRNALRQSRLEETVERLAGRASTLIGDSGAMQAVRELVQRVAPLRETVLITGESGTGKELVAIAVHRAGPRAGREFVRVNCAAIPDDLIESELFGHERGAFTGAVGRQKGKFVQADGGTIFLDEIGDMSLRTQAKVLRVLESHEVEPVGAGRSLRVDVRVLAATNKDLPAEIRAGRFREDLFFRLNVLPIHLPPLRERRADLPLLAAHLARRWCEENGRRPPSLEPDALARLMAHDWPGNVRELRNTVERLLILGDGERVGAAQVDTVLGAKASEAAPPSGAAGLDSLRGHREASERAFLVAQLRAHAWNVSATARAIGTPRSNLYKKLEAYGIRREGEDGA